MNLSKIPIEVLRAEVEAVDAMSRAEEMGDHTPLCDFVGWCSDLPCPLREGECNGLCNECPGWSERKEQYLQHLRAEIESRNITFQELQK